METEKEQLENKIANVVQLIKHSPIGEREEYLKSLRGYSREYRELTGEYYKVE